MSITLELQPEIERGLLSQAQALGVTLEEYLLEIVERQAGASPVAPSNTTVPEAANMVELFANSPFKGLGMEFERDRDFGRDIEL